MKTQLGCVMVIGAALLLSATTPAMAQYGGHGGGYSYVAPSYRVGLSPTLYGYRLGGGYGYGLSRGYGYGLGYRGYGGYSAYRPRLNYIAPRYRGGYGYGLGGYGLGSYGWGGLSSYYSYPYFSSRYGFSGYGWPYPGSSYYSYFGVPYPSGGLSLTLSPSYGGGYYGGVAYRPYVTTSQYVYSPSYYSATYVPGAASYGAVCGAYGYSSICCGY